LRRKCGCVVPHQNDQEECAANSFCPGGNHWREVL
jgi:hypothetical protein